MKLFSKRSIVATASTFFGTLSLLPCDVLATLETSSITKNYFGGTDHAPYIDWLTTGGASFYNASVFLAASASADDTQGAAIHWKVDDEYLYVGVAARAKGWVALGLAEAGGMKGSDVVIFETANPAQLRDTYILDERLPITDDCQDWTFVDSHNDGNFLIFEGVRKLNTYDKQDHFIMNDAEGIVPAQRVIAAWGDTDTAQYHANNIARGGLRWYSGGDEYTVFHEQMEIMSDGFFDIRARNHTLNATETDYVSFCFAWDPDFVAQGVPLNGSIAGIAAEIILDEASAKFVHHADIYAGRLPSNQSGSCYDKKFYGNALYSWAPGSPPLVLPNDVAYTLGPGGGDGYQSFRMQIHYNNPELVQGVVDNGGLRVYYSLTPRTHEVGIMATADPFTSMRGTPLGDGRSRFSYECTPQCSLLALDEPVTVLQEFFHMHNHGVAGVQYHMRDGKVIRQANANYFEFDQAAVHAVRQPSYQVNPGDSFNTICYYFSENGTIFGRSSNQEMCEAVLLYYPAKTVLNIAPWSCVYDVPLPACNATLTHSVLTLNETIDRTFGVGSNGQCSARPSVEGMKNDSSSDSTSGCKRFHGHIEVLLRWWTALLVVATAVVEFH